jgi:four helix bundle protein
MGQVTRVEDMPVYGSMYNLALQVEKVTRAFPHDFKWLRNQVLRSSESVPANMTEGFYAQYSTEYLQSLYRCRREARETMTHIKYAADVKMLEASCVTPLLEEYEGALTGLSSLIASIERKVRAHGKAKPGAVREDHVGYMDEPANMSHQS